MVRLGTDVGQTRLITLHLPKANFLTQTLLTETCPLGFGKFATSKAYSVHFAVTLLWR
jgi:hypothetical protein